MHWKTFRTCTKRTGRIFSSELNASEWLSGLGWFRVLDQDGSGSSTWAETWVLGKLCGSIVLLCASCPFSSKIEDWKTTTMSDLRRFAEHKAQKKGHLSSH